jgi:hypothetical protein
MLRTERRSWRSQAYCTGVSPLGAHVRRRTGWSMKPLSSKKKTGLNELRAPFLSAAIRTRATIVGQLRRIPGRAARVSGKSTSGCGEFSRHETGDRKPETFWRLPPPRVHTSKVRSCSRLAVGHREEFPTTVAFVSHRDEAEDRNAACFSKPRFRLASWPASNVLPKRWTPLQSRRPRRYPCLPAEVVPQADGESPTRLRFHAFSCKNIRIPDS